MKTHVNPKQSVQIVSNLKTHSTSEKNENILTNHEENHGKTTQNIHCKSKHVNFFYCLHYFVYLGEG